MYRRIGFLLAIFAGVLMFNAGPTKAQAPMVAPGGVIEKPAQGPLQLPIITPQCQLCYSCGGSYPVFSGYQSFASSGAVSACELGSGCSSFASSDCGGTSYTGNFSDSLGDINPYLCCK